MSEALREVVQRGLNAPSGEPICCCHNRDAVKAGIEKPCWYCELRITLLAPPPGDGMEECAACHGTGRYPKGTSSNAVDRLKNFLAEPEPPGDGGLREASRNLRDVALTYLNDETSPLSVPAYRKLEDDLERAIREMDSALGRPAETQGGDDTITVYETGGMAIATVPALSTETQGSG